MRSLPGMTVICPADDVEARAAVRAAYAMQGPVYLRFGRLAVPVFHDEATYHFELGKGEQITEGNDIAIIATGLMVNEARLAAEQLAAEGIHARVINIHTIKPLDEEIVLKAAKECGKVITAEEHSVIGGLGEAICAVLSEKLPTPVRRVGVQDKFGLLRPRMGSAQAVRSGCSDHLQDRSRDAGLIPESQYQIKKPVGVCRPAFLRAITVKIRDFSARYPGKRAGCLRPAAKCVKSGAR